MDSGKRYTATEKGALDTAAEYVICMKDGEQLFVAAEYVRKFANFTYEKYDRHLQVYTEWGIIKTYDIAKATQLRVRGGIKSPILRELEAGEGPEKLSVTVLEAEPRRSNHVDSFPFL